LVIHGLVLAVGLVSFSASERRDSTRPVSVDIVAPSAISAIKAGKPDQELERAAKTAMAQKQPAEIVQTAARLTLADTPAAKQAALPPPKPKALPPSENKTQRKEPESETPPEPRPDVKAAAVPPPEKRADAPKPRRRTAQREEPRERRPRPRSRDDRIAELIDRPTLAAQGESDFDPKRISALLNRDPTAGERPAQEGPREPWRRPSTLEEQTSGVDADPRERIARGVPEGRDHRMGANEIDAFRAQISRCWTPPVGGLGGDAIIVKLRIALNEDGSLHGPPDIANSFNSPFFRPAADAAIRAVVQCQPYRMPPESFGQWRDMLLSFDPSRMYGG
jgi:outer membrane biosynthesis protein TonB